jgi:rhodanese-related sulfurtransferase
MASMSRVAVITAFFLAGLLYFSILAEADMSQKLKASAPLKAAPMKTVTLEEVARLFVLGKGTFEIVDCRPLVRYNEGHIPGAISIPDSEFNEFAGKLPREKDELLIFYCAGPGCRPVLSSAAKAEKLGYTRVAIFSEGLHAWKNAGNLVVSSVEALKEYLEKGMLFVLVDLRPTDEARRGHIIGAVSIPGRDIPNAKDRFPSDKSANIILYDNDTRSAADDFVTVRGWGFANISVLEGGFAEWKRSGGLVVMGDVPTKIVYVPRLRQGEISVEEFKRIAETMPSDKLMLDVRDEDEAAQGMLKNAVNVPAWKIKDRLGDLPRDKEIIVYCVNGVLAEISYHTLKEAGYRVRFLNANIRIDRDGKYTISKE